MSTEKIEVNVKWLDQAKSALNKERINLENKSINLSPGETQSIALSDFLNCVEEIKKLKEKYVELLQRDIDKLSRAKSQYEEKDKSLASRTALGSRQNSSSLASDLRLYL